MTKKAIILDGKYQDLIKHYSSFTRLDECYCINSIQLEEMQDWAKEFEHYEDIEKFHEILDLMIDNDCNIFIIQK